MKVYWGWFLIGMLIGALIFSQPGFAREATGTYECYELYTNTTEGEESNEYWIPCGEYDDLGYNQLNCHYILHGEWSEEEESCDVGFMKWYKPNEKIQ